MRGVLGSLFLLAGGLGALWVDIQSSIWLYNEHGIAWVVAAWALFAPLFIIPFLAGYAWRFLLTIAASAVGMWIREG